MTSISRREFATRSATVLASALLPGSRRAAVRGDDMGEAFSIWVRSHAPPRVKTV